VRGEPGVRGRGHLGEPALEVGSAPCRAQSARHLGELAEGAAERDLPVEVRAEAERDLPLVLLRARERRDRGNAEVGGEIERPYRSTHRGVSLDGACDVARADAGEVDAGATEAVVPPECDRVALDELEQALKDRLFGLVAGGAAVAVRTAEAVTLRQRIAEEAVRGGEEGRLVVRNRPRLCPRHWATRVERLGDPRPAIFGGGVSRQTLASLRLGEEEQLVGVHGPFGDVEIAPLHDMAWLAPAG